MNAEATLLESAAVAVPAARILVVEDERIVARSLRKQLTTLGYEIVACVSSGPEAIRQAGEQHPDLVLMDINLEGPMDGVDAAATITKQFRLPVIYLTAYSNKEILERAKITEPFGYILKPYEDRELHVVIEMALYKHRMDRGQQERQRWFTATLKSIGDAVIATDEEGYITYLNPLAEQLLGWKNQDAIGQSLNEVVRLIHKETRQPIQSPLAEARQDCKPSVDLLLIAKDSSEKAIEICVDHITDEKDISLGCVLVFRDVTARKHLEQQYRQAKKMEAIGRLAGGLAHTLNNLMTVVLGHSELMLNDMKPGDPFLSNAQEIKRSATQTAKLTKKLLAFSRKQILTLRRVDLNVVVNELAQAVQNLQDGVRLDLSLEPALGLAKVDPDQLEEALLTLVRNACQAMAFAGRVTIRTANVELGQDYTQDHPEVQPGPYVLLAVSDTGMGMSQEAISSLFEPFYTKEFGMGAGLGLAAVYGFVKQCGGDIEVRSEMAKGTTFCLYLPREIPAAAENKPPG